MIGRDGENKVLADDDALRHPKEVRTLNRLDLARLRARRSSP